MTYRDCSVDESDAKDSSKMDDSTVHLTMERLSWIKLE